MTVWLLALSLGVATPAQERVNPTAEAIAAFQKRVDMYLELRKDLTKKIPEVKETGDPAKISAREKALGQAIATAREGSKPGEIFGDLSSFLREVIAQDWQSRSPADQKATLSELPKSLKMAVNEAYPTNLPLATAPPNLLARLPKLPEELEYRLVDKQLILRDRDANLVIDVLGGTAPAKK
jgi:hypothetical protein